ncbi:rhamnogalacturonan lyase [Nonomuraea sp. KC401]|uniref:rhamnogalacturonan lyase family protein n=1 Tax=unclassified Nonomuraea TaxID=2593643 RepID=UPI0010FEB913|nr:MULTISPECIES: cellulose binding domain-containing protein [unclassified Nonomuraea]NBE95308.1 rhamnogalacturonan lyase [Nonomuraea sp. K271]TLF72403.1 rhamnogalacturonan lyase [Nonomuraea sp. KC401]
MKCLSRPALLVTALAGSVCLVAATAVGLQSPAAAAVACEVDYDVATQWSGGFTGNVTVRNLGDAVDGWRLDWSFTSGQRITQAWNATATQNGAAVTAEDAGHNAAIPRGGSTTFGFNASWDGSGNPAPATFTLNGVTCTGDPGEPTPTVTPTVTPTAPADAKQAEDLDRGLISVRSGNGNLVSWRLLGTEPRDTSFNVYRGGTRIATVTDSTNHLDAGAPSDASYTVRPLTGGAEGPASEPSLRFGDGYLDVPVSPPGGHHANDASVGDLDGDGRLDLVLKWEADNSKDNSQSGTTDVVYIDGIKLDGTRLWRINLGRNIRAGAHYTQFQVYDYDGDGRAEVAMKTADGTVDGRGTVIGNANADHRNSSGYVLSGPEFLTMFDGRTGAALSTVNYDPPRGNVSSWGDSYGNRVDRFLAGTAYLDGQRPSLIMARGYYTRSVIAAWDFRDGRLVKRWTFDSNASGNGSYAGQGNHSLTVGDVDADGRDEIVYGAAAIDDDGGRLWNVGWGHGDAAHLGDLDPGRPGQEYVKISESGNRPGLYMVDARTGQVLWRTGSGSGSDGEGPGRGVAADIHAGSPGAESWASGAGQNGLRNTSGTVVGRQPSSANFLSWWDGDPVRELLDQTRIDKYGTGGETRLLTASGVHSNNGTKANPSLSGDILGDWREEVIWPTTDNRALRIYATPHVTTTKIHTLLHDPQYRVALAWQNTAYNQPPHPSFFIGDGMSTPPQPRVHVR